MIDIKPCPFCGSRDIRHSIKTTGSQGQTRYMSQLYCNKCHTYGPRILSEKAYCRDYGKLEQIATNPKLKNDAIEAWNRREK